jgi:hypothetical protein
MKIDMTIPDNLPVDLVVTAVEAGYDGIGYWAEVTNYDPDKGTCHIKVMSGEDCEQEGMQFDLTPAGICVGLSAMSVAGQQALGRILIEEYDAWDADVCIQFAFFGEVIFG